MFINRDENGKIVALFANQQYEGQEYLEGAELDTSEDNTKVEQIKALIQSDDPFVNLIISNLDKLALMGLTAPPEIQQAWDELK